MRLNTAVAKREEYTKETQKHLVVTRIVDDLSSPYPLLDLRLLIHCISSAASTVFDRRLITKLLLKPSTPAPTEVTVLHVGGAID